MSRRKLMINLIIFAVCGAIALTIPVFVNCWQDKSTMASNDRPTCVLKSVFVGDEFSFSDSWVVWQIYLTQGDTIVADWHAIYTSINAGAPIDYDTKNLQLTANGFCYRGLDFEHLYSSNYSSSVTYKNYTCTLTLAQP